MAPGFVVLGSGEADSGGRRRSSPAPWRRLRRLFSARIIARPARRFGEKPDTRSGKQRVRRPTEPSWSIPRPSREQDSWTALATRIFPTTGGGDGIRQADLDGVVSRDADMLSTLVDIGVAPLDEHNTELLDNVHPANWIDAEPDGVSELAGGRGPGRRAQ